MKLYENAKKQHFEMEMQLEATQKLEAVNMEYIN
jgi:hypothetical protein